MTADRPTPVWVRNLLEWFAANRRPMPWRDAPTPYAVWISEMMLQQTQVATVIPYFERFIRRFPDVRHLAAARLEDVLKQWEGLGYYSRARHLLAAARQISGPLGGRFPTTAADWRSLPGIGDYAAAAIASIAFGESAPVVDGNVLRVYARRRGITEPVSSQAARDLIRRRLRPAIRQSRDPAAFNQAMMELGALVCRPRSPMCDSCPLRRGCMARRLGITGIIPAKTQKTPVPHYTEAAMILHDPGGRILMRKRPVRGLLGGLWEFPGIRRTGRESLTGGLCRALASETGCAITITRKCGVVRHTFSHFRQTLHVYEGCTGAPVIIATNKPSGRAPLSRWRHPDDIQALPLSKAHRDIASMITQHLTQDRDLP